jgi:beta-mannanase
VDTLQATLQRRVSIVHWYVNWSASHIKWDGRKAIRAVLRSHRKPLMTWLPAEANGGNNPWQPRFSLETIARGDHDDYIWHWAKMMSRFHKRIYVRPMQEMNGNWFPWGGTVNGNSPAKFRAAWRHIVDVSRGAGAHNIRWVWCPLAEDVPNQKGNHFEIYYPGRKYVDVLGLNGYNWGAGAQWAGGWRSFKKIFKGPYKRIRKLGPQPIWIPEIGSASDGGDKAAWVRKMWKVASHWKRLKAIVWFDQDKEKDWSAVHVAQAFHR